MVVINLTDGQKTIKEKIDSGVGDSIDSEALLRGDVIETSNNSSVKMSLNTSFKSNAKRLALDFGAEEREAVAVRRLQPQLLSGEGGNP